MHTIQSRVIYLDNASTTPLDPRVREAMLPYLTERYGNPSSIHKVGREAREAVEDARRKVADTIGASPEEIYFTGSGSEGNNLAIKGIAWANRSRGKHIITTKIEHKCVLNTCHYLEKHGFDITYLDVDEYGVVDLEQLKSSLRDDTILVSVMYANNEVGTLQPIKEISQILKKRDIYLHTDAVQVLGKLPLDVEKLGVDVLTLSAHKIYGPKGVGAVYVRKGTRMDPLIHGGGQERGLRSGTENVPGIVGFGTAAELAKNLLLEDKAKFERFSEKLINEIPERIENVKFNGHPKKRVPNIVNFSFPRVEGESIVMYLDLEGIAASTGSACTSKSLEPSHVLTAMGISPEVAHGSLRISFGRFNDEYDVDKLLEVLPGIIEKLRKMSPLG
ncbi:MAG: cysteine desulfurase NifS [Candidatus Aenigmatarchaeota archaeon]|mgnify:CR=1 FL=1|nr:MAG: cysteine desulfurase NifS [Candidatus Aenigmarchaeota archaeon]